jgi:four helix bundle protein
MATYKDLIVWQKAIALVKDVYIETEGFPSREMYGLTSQIRRSAVSIPSNIAEGHGRRSDADFGRFLTISLGSLFEMETQLVIAREIGFLDQERHLTLANQVDEVEAMLEALLRKVKAQS